MFTPRTKPLKYGEKPWVWDVPSVYQCTWYCYFRALSVLSAPCWWDRLTHTGSYTNAKDWLENYRDPWEVKDRDWTPRAGDIAVFDGEYGHVQFMETDVMFSEYSNGDPNSFRTGKFVKKDNLLGFLHYPYETVNPVDRNPNVNQIETTDDTLRIRVAPSLNAEIVGHVQLGYYNVLDTAEADGYTWYKIAENRWCANVTVNYLPKSDDDFIEQIKKWADAMIADAKAKQEKIEKAEKDFKAINEITEKWL